MRASCRYAGWGRRPSDLSPYNTAYDRTHLLNLCKYNSWRSSINSSRAPLSRNLSVTSKGLCKARDRRHKMPSPCAAQRFVVAVRRNAIRAPVNRKSRVVQTLIKAPSSRSSPINDRIVSSRGEPLLSQHDWIRMRCITPTTTPRCRSYEHSPDGNRKSLQHNDLQRLLQLLSEHSSSDNRVRAATRSRLFAMSIDGRATNEFR
jgi:hypothetical protein